MCIFAYRCRSVRVNKQKRIEKKWLAHFRTCPLVHAETRLFQAHWAYYLFYGELPEACEDPYPPHFPEPFLPFFERVSEKVDKQAISFILGYFKFIGITLQKKRVQAHLKKYPEDAQKLLLKCYYILKTLAHQPEKMDVEKPYLDNNGDLFFLLRIESEESITGGQLVLFGEMQLPDLYSKVLHIPEGYENDEFLMDLFHRIENTQESFFITGKAGTGKSTFIHYFARKTKKNVLMTAFTGIAAMNVGGQTLHSFFRLPLKPLMPEDHEIPEFKPYTHKYKIIEKLDTLIIDEVSMLRADILEAIDYSLRKNGGNPYQLFGGKQVIFIGDVFQLPPITRMESEVEKYLFSEIFPGKYFFHSHAYRRLNPLYCELTKVHRQKNDLPFLQLLDKVRVGQVQDADLEQLNTRYYPNYSPRLDEFVMHLTSNNMLAKQENQTKLASIDSPTYLFEAIIEGEFTEDRYPTDKVLHLKKNAQIIFVKNDSEGKWVNGTIAKVDFIQPGMLEVRLQNGTVHRLVQELWENRKYKFDRGSGKILSEVVGTFRQFPVKLAWAVTIHKSQGLTFDRIVVDMGRGAFINGQVYTALSRSRSLQGIVLKQKIHLRDIMMDPRIVEFHETETLLSRFRPSSEKNPD